MKQDQQNKKDFNRWMNMLRRESAQLFGVADIVSFSQAMSAAITGIHKEFNFHSLRCAVSTLGDDEKAALKELLNEKPKTEQLEDKIEKINHKPLKNTTTKKEAKANAN